MGNKRVCLIAFSLCFILAGCNLPFPAPSTPIPAMPTIKLIPTLTSVPTTIPTPTQVTEPADIIFHNGVIITIEDSLPTAQAIAIRGSLIQAVGSEAEVAAYQGPQTVVVDLQGHALMPGIIDGHSHYVRNAYEAGVPLEEIQNNLLRYGITGDTEMHSVASIITAFQAAESRGEIKVRLNIFGDYNCGFLDENGESLECFSWYPENPPILDPNLMVRVPGVKIFVDGAGTPSRGCPYKSFPWPANITDVWPDIAETCKKPYGDLYVSQEKLTAVVQDIQDKGFRAAFHAMGDAAITIVLNTLEVVLNGESDLVYRHQIEHNSVVSPEMLERYMQMDVLAQFGGSFNVSEAHFYEVAYGAEHYTWAANRYALPGLGVHTIFGQDYNNRGRTETLNPFPDLFGYVTHRELLADGSIADPPEWVSIHQISVAQALKMMTYEPAFAVSMEDYLGSLKAGKFADLIILSDNPLSMDPNDLYKLTVLMTMVNGVMEYCAPDMNSYCPVPGQIPAAVPSEAVAPTSLAPQTAQFKWNCDAFASTPVHAASTDRIQLFIRWAAQTQAQVEDYRSAVRSSLAVDGVSVQTDLSHSEISTLEGSGMPYITSYFNLGSLAPGQHVIRTTLTFEHAITDGMLGYGPATENPSLEGTCTVISEP